MNISSAFLRNLIGGTINTMRVSSSASFWHQTQWFKYLAPGSITHSGSSSNSHIDNGAIESSIERWVAFTVYLVYHLSSNVTIYHSISYSNLSIGYTYDKTVLSLQRLESFNWSSKTQDYLVLGVAVLVFTKRGSRLVVSVSWLFFQDSKFESLKTPPVGVAQT